MLTARQSLLAIPFWLLTGAAHAQLEISLSLDSNRYAVGEPIFLNTELTNTGATAIQFQVGDSYGCGGYRVELVAAPSAENSTCATFTSTVCTVGGRVIDPGVVIQEQLLLSFEYVLSTLGEYEFQIRRALRFGPAGERIPFPDDVVTAESHFVIQLDAADSEDLETLYEPYLAILNAPDQGTSREDALREAARVIVSLAPPSLEDTIFGLLDSTKTRRLALLGLRRLNTARAREALADIVRNTPGYSYERELAIRYLSEMQDKTYFSLLIDEAGKVPANQAKFYIQSAARLGGDDAMPYLTSLLASTDPFLRSAAQQSLPLTGSRSAVPVLIDQLRDTNEDFAVVAGIMLGEMTHLSPSGTSSYSDSPAEDHTAWSAWWAQYGSNAPLYRPWPDQCGTIEKLPD